MSLWTNVRGTIYLNDSVINDLNEYNLDSLLSLTNWSKLFKSTESPINISFVSKPIDTNKVASSNFNFETEPTKVVQEIVIQGNLRDNQATKLEFEMEMDSILEFLNGRYSTAYSNIFTSAYFKVHSDFEIEPFNYVWDISENTGEF